MKKLNFSLLKNTLANKLSKRDYRAERVLFYLSPFIIVLALNVLQMPHFTFDMNEILFSFIKMLISVILVLSFQMFFTSLFGNKLSGVYFTNISFLTLGIISVIKMAQTSSPIVPSSFSLTKQIGKISDFVKVPWSVPFVLGCIIIALNLTFYTFLWIYVRKKQSFSIKKYTASLVLSALFFSIVFYGVSFSSFAKEKVFPFIKCNISSFDSATDYRNNGLILTFFPRLGDVKVETPLGYDENELNKIKNEWEFKKFNENATAHDVTVIAIQAESWWDPTRLSDVEYSADPLSFTRNIKDGYFGTFVSPSFGCNTCIPEFEYLTGNSTVFLPEGGYPYTQFVKKPINSIAKIFKYNGYDTIAIHTYDKEYYSRNEAYPMLGFDKLLGDTDLEKPMSKGPYISDMYMAEQIIKMYNEKQNPLFMFAVSMQNHGDYATERYADYDIDLKSEKLTTDEITELRTAVQGVYDIDKAFEHLVKYFENQDEKVLIVMYGDHLPFIGKNNSVYTKLGLMNGTSLAQNPVLYETPYVVWANYDIKDANLSNIVSPQYLGINTVKLAGIKNVPWQYKFIDEFYKKYTVYQHNVLYDEHGKKTDEKKIDQKLLDEYKIIQYNMIFD